MSNKSPLYYQRVVTTFSKSSIDKSINKSKQNIAFIEKCRLLQKNEAKVCCKRYVVQGCTKNFEKNKLWETLINCGAFFSDFTVMSDGHYI